MKVLEFNVDFEHGFAWILIEDKNKDVFTVQCCINRLYDEPEIIVDDCGEDWGICGDVNKQAFEKFGQGKCMTELFKEAKKHGIKLV